MNKVKYFQEMSWKDLKTSIDMFIYNNRNDPINPISISHVLNPKADIGNFKFTAILIYEVGEKE